MFKPVDPKQSFPALEEALVQHWKEAKTFEKSVQQGKKDYVFYDGPPFATGLPHYGHLLAGTIKDSVPRYWTMQGYRIERNWGWDCHGLPIENMIEQELGLKSKKEIVRYGVGKFNESCRATVLKYAEEWKKTVTRMGRWVDMENDYKTMNPSYMESLWWVFKQLHEKGLVYEGRKSIHICPRCETPLSNFEVGQGYKDVTDFSVTAKFELVDEPGTFVLAWTTTPWTLPGNVTLAVEKDIEYVKVRLGDKHFILAKAVFEKDAYRKEFGDKALVVETILGKTLVKKRYKPLFEYYANQNIKNIENGYKVIAASFVSTEEGTGIVHIAPAFGEDDMQAGLDNELPFVQHVGMDGKFTQDVTEWANKDCKKMDQNIVEHLKTKQLVFQTAHYTHSYPHCWRCETPLLNYTTTSWFIIASKLKNQMIKANQKIQWAPGHIKEGRFGKWLENVKDWSISRGRYWGTPIPIWRNVDDPSDVLVVGSIEELHALSGTRISDLHKHIVDKIEIQKDGKKYRRIEDVFDCWFESGSMPYGQLHYPFENQQKFEDNFPADFIGEGVDQTRCWFYVLHVLSNALFRKPAFKNVIVNGIVLAENGQKMSKRLKNYPDPNDILNKYGADALRFYMLNSPVVMAGDMRFSEQGVEHVLRNMMIPVWNAYSFFVTYANIDGWTPAVTNVGVRHALPLHLSLRGRSANKLDRWILAELNQLIAAQIEYFKVYDLQKASNAVYKFVEDLTNWYIRRSRRRFWKSEDDADKNHAYATLFTVLTKLCQVLAPFMPFISEAIYCNLTGEESVHLTKYPKPDKKAFDESLVHEIHLAKTIVSLGLAARSKKKIKVRQPLRKIDVVLRDPADHALLTDQIDMIKEEMNVKEIIFVADASEFATRIVKPDARKLGPKYGKDVQQIIQAAKNGQFEELGNGNILVETRRGASPSGTPDGATQKFELTPDEASIEYAPKSGFDIEASDGILIALDTEITPELKQEGMARDLVRQIQDLRKDANYKVDDRIEIALIAQNVAETQNFASLLKRFGDYIQQETLAISITSDLAEPDRVMSYERVTIKVKRV
ncbi:isoleucine--tRNA ligase [Candidatus Peregrinibacteria bacterium]|nr:isoleucine--tRNA ligase [Candidatus Peregrinibacteria bacterium]